jgi:hypothetical protein
VDDKRREILVYRRARLTILKLLIGFERSPMPLLLFRLVLAVYFIIDDWC